MLDQALGLFDYHVGDLNVANGRLVEGRADDLALDRALHIGNFLGPFVDQQHQQIDIGAVDRERVGDRLQQHGLAGARRGDDKRPLSLAKRRNKIDYPRTYIFSRGIVDLERKHIIGVERRQVVEIDLVAGLLRFFEVNLVEAQKREVALALFRRADLPVDGIAGA